MNTIIKFRRILRRAVGKILMYCVISDKIYLSILYYIRIGKIINWNNPKTFNEKMQWLKLYGHQPLYTLLADKYAVKEYVSKLIGRQYVVPCLGVWNHPDEIDFEKLPKQFVLKCNHNSGLGRCICENKDSLDIAKVRLSIGRGLRQNYYLPGRDKQYRDIPKKIIADKYLNDNTGEELRDYKFWCFNGEPKYMYCTNKGENIYENFYDMDFNPIYIDHGFPRILPEIEKPDEFDIMKRLAKELSKGIPFVRVDFFDVNHHVYFGEFTFFDWGGLRPFKDNWDEILGSYIILPQK